MRVKEGKREEGGEGKGRWSEGREVDPIHTLTLKTEQKFDCRIGKGGVPCRPFRFIPNAFIPKLF